jgi:hypothetical protein
MKLMPISTARARNRKDDRSVEPSIDVTKMPSSPHVDKGGSSATAWRAFQQIA